MVLWDHLGTLFFDGWFWFLEFFIWTILEKYCLIEFLNCKSGLNEITNDIAQLLSVIGHPGKETSVGTACLPLGKQFQEGETAGDLLMILPRDSHLAPRKGHSQLFLLVGLSISSGREAAPHYVYSPIC